MWALTQLSSPWTLKYVYPGQCLNETHSLTLMLLVSEPPAEGWTLFFFVLMASLSSRKSLRSCHANFRARVCAKMNFMLISGAKMTIDSGSISIKPPLVSSLQWGFQQQVVVCSEWFVSLIVGIHSQVCDLGWCGVIVKWVFPVPAVGVTQADPLWRVTLMFMNGSDCVSGRFCRVPETFLTR